MEKNFGKKLSSSLTVHDKGREGDRHSQRSTLYLGRTDVRDFAKNGCDCMARGQLERIAKVSQLQFSWCKFKRS